jgi:carboxypeptidase family protein
MLYTSRQLLILLLVTSSLSIPSMLMGQARTEGQLSGKIVDPSGAVVPEATLTLSQASTGINLNAGANASGEYVFPTVLPGTYKLTVDAKGFSQAVYNDVHVYTGRTTDLNLTLRLGSASEKVDVSAAGEVLETTTNTLATTVAADAIQDLPLSGRDVLPFAQLVPGAQVGGDLRFTTYNSMPNAAISISVDGTNNNFQRFRTSTTGFFEAAALRVGAIDEVSVSTSNLTADAGAEGAVTLRFTTKRGTNQFHGSAFWQAYNSGFNANSYQNDAYLAAGLTSLGRKQPFHTNDFGANIGGPIIRNKLFFFFNYEFENQPGKAIFTQGVLTTAAQAGMYTYSRADNGQPQTVSLYSIAAQAGFPATPNANVQSVLNDVNKLATKGTLSPNTTDPYLQNLQSTLNFTATQNTKQRWPTARVDYLVTPKITWHASYDLYWRTYPTTPVYPEGPVQLYGFQSSYSTFSTGVDWTINSHLINQTNFGILNTQERAQPGNSFDAFRGINYLPVASSFAVNGLPAFTPPIPYNSGILPEPRNNPVWDFTDNVSWSRGHHTFTFGGHYRFSNQHDVNTQPPVAENLGISGNDPAASMFNTNPVAGCTQDIQGCFPGGLSTANNNEALVDAEALYSTLTGRVASISGFVPLDTATKKYQEGGVTSIKEKQTVGGVYLQDAWKITPRLSLNYGFRWQFSSALTNTNGYFTSPTLADLFGPSTALFQPGVLNGNPNPQLQLRPSSYTGDFKQPAPNVGFAWNPDFKTGWLQKLAGKDNLVIRGGFAVNHYDEGWIPWENVATGSLSNQTVSLNPGQFSPGSISFDPVGASLPALNSVPGSFSLPIPQAALTFTRDGVFSTVDPKIRTPYIENWTLGFERALTGNWALDVNYVGNHSVHMWEAFDLNEVNIFQNVKGLDSFLQDFQAAQQNLTASGGTSFAGPNPTPILTQAFAGQPVGSTFQNPSNLFLVQTGQAGALAGAITQNPVFFCNLVGKTFSPCVTQGYNSNAPSPVAYPINFFQVNPYSGGQPLTLLSDPGSASYNGLQVQVKHTAGHGLNFMANYTFSHSLTNRYLGDYYQADGALVDFTTLRNPRLNRVPSPYDLRHVFKTYFNYDLPFGRGRTFKTGNSFVDGIIGGWTLGSVIAAQTGRNFKLAGGVNTYNYWDGPTPANANGTPAGILNYVPNENDSGVTLNGITPSQLQSKVGVYSTGNPYAPVSVLPTSLFGPGGAIQPSSTPGQLGSVIFLKGPRLFNTDISIIKNIPITEHVKMNIYAEMLNAFNHPNFNFTDSYSGGTNNPAQFLLVNSAPYAPGTVGQNSNRQIQFRMQLAF